MGGVIRLNKNAKRDVDVEQVNVNGVAGYGTTI